MRTGTTCSDSMPVFGLKLLIFWKPGSITNLMPSIVRLVSAMFVASTTFLQPCGVGSNTLACSSVGRFA